MRNIATYWKRRGGWRNQAAWSVIGIRFLIVVVLALSLFITVQNVWAHGYIVRAIPENRAVFQHPPPRLQYWFSEALEPEFSEINVRDQSGNILATGGVDKDNTTLLTVRLPSDLADGAYIVELRPAFASDGHVIAESRVFFIGEEVGGVAGQGATTSAVPLEVVWRAMVLMSTMLLFGAFTLYAGVLVPAWGSEKYPAGLLPPRVMRRLNLIVGVALVIVFAGNILALIQQTMVFFNIGFTQALNPDFWSLVRIGSRFGDIWNFRMLFLAVVALMFGASLYFRGSQPETVRAFWVGNAWMMILVVGSFSALSHAAGSLMWPWPGIVIDWLHSLAVGFWVGGLVALVLVLPVALAPYEGEPRRQALLAVLRRFSRVAAAAVVIVIATGLFNASIWVRGPEEAQSNFGASLLLKLVLVGLLVGMGALHHLALHPERYRDLEVWFRRVAGFGFSLRLEAFFALAVLASVGLLSATPVPVPTFANQAQDIEAPSADLTVNDLSLTMDISPGGPGVNTYDLVFTEDGQRVEGLTVGLSLVNPSRDWRSPGQFAEPVEPGLYVTVGDEIDRDGVWWALVDVADEEGLSTRFAFEWEIDADASVIQSINPNFANLLALILVFVAIAWVLYPSARWVYHRLDLQPITLAVAVSVIVVTVVVIGIGYSVVNRSRQRYDETLNPPPDVVNSVLPSQQSLERGAALYEEHCITWQTVPQDFNALRERLARTQDDDLFAATVDGWRGLPPCQGALTDAERWDVVNYFRTLGRSTE
jgi:putative copper export protein/methionine-rich copper-binding protein CopC